MTARCLKLLTPAGWAAVTVCAALLGLLSWCRIDGRRDAAFERARAEAVVRDLTRESAARDRAAAERLADARANANLEKEMTDAVSTYPDARPSDRRVALACARLRRQGTADADLPARCRPGG